jgi:hypothetical protein
MNTLVIHKLPFLRNNHLISVADTELVLKKFKSSDKIFFWNYKIPASIKLKKFPWDIIFITSTVLSDVHTPFTNDKMKKRLEFLEKSDAFKIVLPQDEYYCPDNLAEVFTNWNINYLITLDYNQRNKIYPTIFSNSRVKFKQGYTFYYSELYEKMHKNNFYKSLSSRPLDIVYRAHKPIYANELAWQKYELNEKLAFASRDKGKNLRLDLFGEIIKGRKWQKFLSSSKSVIGSNSGSNLILRNLDIIERTRNFIAKYNRQPDYNQLLDMGIEQNDYGNFTMISPRNMEAAATGTIQILVTGGYSELLDPATDYIGTDFEFTNFEHIFNLLNDEEFLDSVRFSAWNNLSSNPQLKFENLWKDILTEYSCFQKDALGVFNGVPSGVTAIKILNFFKIEHYMREKFRNYMQYKLNKYTNLSRN